MGERVSCWSVGPLVVSLVGYTQGIPQAFGLLLATEYQCPSIAKQESQDALDIPDEPPCYAKN